LQETGDQTFYRGYYYCLDDYTSLRMESYERPFVATAEVFWDWTLTQIAETMKEQAWISTGTIDRFSYEKSLKNLVQMEKCQQLMEERFMEAFLLATEHGGVSVDVLVRAAREAQESMGKPVLLAIVPPGGPTGRGGKAPPPFSVRLAAELVKRGRLSLAGRLRIVKVLEELGDPRAIDGIENCLNTQINPNDTDSREKIEVCLEILRKKGEEQ